MCMLMGPHTALGNIPRSIEYNVDWVTGLIGYMREHNLTRADARPEAVVAWTDYVREKADRPALQRGQLLDDRHQLQRGGQANPHSRPLQRQRPCISRVVRRGRGQGISRSSPWPRGPLNACRPHPVSNSLHPGSRRDMRLFFRNAHPLAPAPRQVQLGRSLSEGLRPAARQARRECRPAHGRLHGRAGARARSGPVLSRRARAPDARSRAAPPRRQPDRRLRGQLLSGGPYRHAGARSQGSRPRCAMS